MGPFSMVWPGIMSDVRSSLSTKALGTLGQEYVFDLICVVCQRKTIDYVGRAVALIENGHVDLVNSHQISAAFVQILLGLKVSFVNPEAHGEFRHVKTELALHHELPELKQLKLHQSRLRLTALTG